MTIRSLSHHLALICDTEAVPRWYNTYSSNSQRFRESLNLLLLPWPMKVNPGQFRSVDEEVIKKTNISEKEFGLFQFVPSEPNRMEIAKVEKLCRQVTDEIGALHGIVLPEMATNKHGLDLLIDVAEKERVEILIAGVYEPGMAGRPAEKFVAVWRPMARSETTGHALRFLRGTYQSKHHRWILDRSQICQYGIGGTLSPTRKWWEYIEMRERSLEFINVDGWLTLATLICEDLARPDPVTEMIRSVGPNLVIALLQDGPQLASRWPARYATVLADDPGSSVLTLTGVGMALLSRPPAKPASRVVALWKEANGHLVETELPPGADALVLCLSREMERQWTADGRHDDGQTGKVCLAGVHSVSLPVRA